MWKHGQDKSDRLIYIQILSMLSHGEHGKLDRVVKLKSNTCNHSIRFIETLIRNASDDKCLESNIFA